LRAEVIDRDARAGAGECDRDRAPDPGGGTGDERRPAFEPGISDGGEEGNAHAPRNRSALPAAEVVFTWP